MLKPDTVKLPRWNGKPFECECGLYVFESNRRSHRSQHLAWLFGQPIISSVRWPYGHAIHVVNSHTSPKSAYTLARKVGETARVEGRYDYNSMPHPDSANGLPTIHTYLYQQDNRVVGFLPTWPVGCVYALDPEHAQDPSRRYSRRVDRNATCGINAVWVHRQYRRQGIATQLLEAVQSDPARHPGPLSWSLPFSPEGRALAIGRTGNTPMSVFFSPERDI